MARPLIGVTASTGPSRSGERASLGAAYLLAVQGAGGVPILLPPQLDSESLRALGAQLDGLILTGGGDINPSRYGEEPHPEVAGVSEERDALEAAAIDLALDRSLPILAICRGMQMLNVALGGSLHQDIPSDFTTAINHAQTSGESLRERSDVTHAVTIEEASRLAQVLGSGELMVNSMHHQAVKGLGRDLRPVAWAPDGVIEALDLESSDRFVLAVQWHAEELVATHDHARRLFEALVQNAAAR
jgi:putative glutamine amidotransferase